MPLSRRQLLALSFWPLVGAGLGVQAKASGRPDDSGRRDDADANPRLVILRHALAPGVGDPPGWTLDDCSTQRNLSDEGRAQARALGDALRALGAGNDTAEGPAPVEWEVWTSAWCRCRETAALLDVGAPRHLEALDSTFHSENRRFRAERTAALQAHLAARGRRAVNAVYVTHLVNIVDLVGQSAASGQGFLLSVDASRQPPTVAVRAPFPA